MIFMGVDPGFAGAIAFIEDVEGDEYARVHDMPTRQQGNNTRIDRPAVVSLLRRELECGRAAAVVEAISAMGGKRTKDGRERREGTVSMVNFGRGQGELLGILEAMGVKIYEIAPATWKAKCGLIQVHEKELCKRAQVMFGIPLLGPKGGALHGRAEALYMARYARKLVTGKEIYES